jgi:hypothetical protein
MELRRGLLTLVIVTAPGSALAEDFDVVSSSHDGLVLARQIVPPSEVTGMADSRVIYLAHDGVTLRPGENDSHAQTSTIVQKPVSIPAWDIQPAAWSETVACIAQVYERFDVTVTDTDPGDVPHIEAIFGGSPAMLGLSHNIAGISPFTTDCGIIERSIVFGFTDVVGDDTHAACQVMAQEIAHSYGLDHELAADDPMTYLPYSGDREFQDRAVSCGEYTARPCGIGGSICRPSQNSVALLAARVGMAGAVTPPSAIVAEPIGDLRGGCAAGGGGSLGVALALLGLVRRRQ